MGRIYFKKGTGVRLLIRSVAFMVILMFTALFFVLQKAQEDKHNRPVKTVTLPQPKPKTYVEVIPKQTVNVLTQQPPKPPAAPTSDDDDVGMTILYSILLILLLIVFLAIMSV